MVDQIDKGAQYFAKVVWCGWEANMENIRYEY